MAISSALNTGLQGIQTGIRQLDGAAGNVARLNGAVPGNQGVGNLNADTAGPEAGRGPAPAALTTAIVEQVEAGVMVQASAATVEVASDNLGTLIDTMV